MTAKPSEPDEPWLQLDMINRTGDPELQQLVDTCKRCLSGPQLLALRTDEDLCRAVGNSPNCGAEMAENMAVAKRVLRRHLDRLPKDLL